ncbi:hypothetical protein BDP27DRAFT_1421869 [Rhodocollybia butyracea]|uniref:Large ribosomal subunit protein mL59 domain-containing protein n=1 Tax=Rhodocollybia butyracea TaxID=206335 RepID=A0A9P5PU13_9AGAR|nr:hypothetical protein BDP27DRAFT_1421869 [Rhodocollybia butyracea]
MSAVQTLRKFRIHELKGLQGHITHFGPLPASEKASSFSVQLPNPFIPHRNPYTGRWAPPKYSLRRQAELIKEAKTSNDLDLLPPGPKLSSAAATSLSKKLDAIVGSAEKLSVLDEALAFPVDWVGKFEPRITTGSDLGVRLYAGKKRMFKGHKWERTKPRREAHKSMLMRDMDWRVTKFKGEHHYRSRNPLKPNQSTKLPF